MPFAYDLSGTLLEQRYRLKGLLGKGGMGFVYDAEHIGLEQRVAIKVLHPRYANEERFRERFIREARSASKIKHRNVVRISDFGNTPDGSVYFAMEFLEGDDLGAELKRTGALDWPRTRHILRQVVGALRAAHAKSIIHRDIKPGNVFLTEDQDEGLIDIVKVLDFGIAKIGTESQRDAQGKGLTDTGEIFGTATYMSPEQARGEPLDARSDMYSLGIMAYEMLTGKVPFTGVNSIHIITRQLSDAPEPLRSVEPRVPADVEALVLKTIAKRREDRFGSMAELEQALKQIPETAGGRRTLVWGVNAPQGGGGTRKVSGASQRADAPTAVESVGVAGAGSTGKPPGLAVGGAPPMAFAPTAAQPSLGIPGGTDPSRPPPGRVDPSRPPPGRVDPSHPPPGSLDPSRPLPGRVDPSHHPPSSLDPASWGVSGTGPVMRLSADAAVETSPHGIEFEASRANTVRVFLGLGLLTLVVIVGSVLGTMAFISGTDDASRDAAEENADHAAPSVPEPDASKSPDVSPMAPAPANAVEPVPAPEAGESQEVVAPTSSGSSGSGGVADETSEPPDLGSAIGSATEANDEANPPIPKSPADEEPEDELILEDDEPEPVIDDQTEKPTGGEKAEPVGPMHETESCAKTRADAAAAFGARTWAKAAKLTKKRLCWSSASQEERLGWRVRALLELGKFSLCVKAGSRAKSAKTKGMVATCQKNRG